MLEFVYNQGLNALISVGRDSDQTYQQYILKALGELAVYVDGMHGLIQCNEMIQWLYQLTQSKVRVEYVCLKPYIWLKIQSLLFTTQSVRISFCFDSRYVHTRIHTFTPCLI